jgi:predicted DNA binding protein
MNTTSGIDWEARFACEKPLTIKTIEKRFADIPAGSSMLIVTPRMVDDFVRKLPKRAFVEQTDIRKALSVEHKSDYACPVTTGIALRVIAERAYARIIAGAADRDVTPFWRAVAPSSDLAKKLSFGNTYIIQKRKEEMA